MTLCSHPVPVVQAGTEAHSYVFRAGTETILRMQAGPYSNPMDLLYNARLSRRGSPLWLPGTNTSGERDGAETVP